MLCINLHSDAYRKPLSCVNQEFRNTRVHRTLLKPSEKMSNSLRSDNPFSLITQKPIHQVLLQIPSSTLYKCCFLHFAADITRINSLYSFSLLFLQCFQTRLPHWTAGRRPVGNPPHERKWDDGGETNQKFKTDIVKQENGHCSGLL